MIWERLSDLGDVERLGRGWVGRMGERLCDLMI